MIAVLGALVGVGSLIGAATRPAAPAVQVASTPVPVPDRTSAARPVRVDVDAIDVHATVVPLGLAPDGTVEVPPLGSPDAGWYTGSPSPGELGPAVLLGHVNSARHGPGVFARLAELVPGDTVRVTSTGGAVATFRVERVEQVQKAEFPTAQVYGDLDHPGLRLITCGGPLSAGNYRDNVIVYAA